MRKHAIDVKMAKVLFLAADPLKAGSMDAAPIAKSSMHMLNAVCPMVSIRNKGKQRKC
jgi:hypothetical protein